MGRPTKLTPDVQQTLAFALSEGATVEHACDYASITPRTFYHWMQRGESGEEQEYLQFFHTITRARPGHRDRPLDHLQSRPGW